MSSIDSPSSRKRPAPSEREESWHVDHPVKRSKTYSAGEIATDLASTVIRGLSLVKETMADWLLTPRRDYHSLYNVRRREETGGRRVLPQGQVTTRPGATEWTRLSEAPDRISDGMLSFKPLSDQSKLKVESFRFGQNGSANGTTSHMNGGHRPLPPSEKFGRRRMDDNFREYTNMGPRLFAKATRKMKYYGATADRVRNLEEKNNYARLLATLRNDDITGAALTRDRSGQQSSQKRRPIDDVIITGVDTSHNVTSRSTATSVWEPVEDSLLYVRTSKNRHQPHSLKPWNSRTRIAAKFNRLPRDQSTPDKSRSSNQSFGFDVRNGSTNHSEESSQEHEQHLDASFGLSNFVNRLRHGLESKKPLSDLFPNDVTDSIVTSPVTSLTPKSKTSRIKNVIDLATEGKEDKNDDVVLVLSDDDEDDVQVELEELSPKKHGLSRDDSPLLPELIMEPARRESRTNSTCSNDDLQRRLRSIPYADASWIRLQRQESDTKAEAFLRSRVEAEMEIKAFQEARLKQSEQLEEAIKKKLRIAELVPAVLEEPEEEEEEEELYPELTTEMENMVDSALYGGPGSEVLVDHMRIQIRRSDVKTLEGTTWLNDEVINFHMNLLIQRGQEDGRPKVHAFNTFFYQKLVQDGHVSLKRWTRKIDVFAKDYLVVPVHLQMHWCMAIVDFRKKEIRYYDSMGGKNNTCLSAIRGYLEEESVDKKKQKYDTSSWKLINAKGPQQMNGSDCGVFSTICAEHVTRDAPLTYSQDLMPYFRRRMVYEIITKKLMQ